MSEKSLIFFIKITSSLLRSINEKIFSQHFLFQPPLINPAKLPKEVPAPLEAAEVMFVSPYDLDDGDLMMMMMMVTIIMMTVTMLKS